MFWDYKSPQITNYYLDFVKSNPDPSNLFITALLHIPILMENDGINPEQFMMQKDYLLERLRQGQYKNVYLLHTQSNTIPYFMNIEVDEYMKNFPELKYGEISRIAIHPEMMMVVHNLSLKNP